MDKETQAVMLDGEEIRAMTSGKGWELVKSKLDARILDLQNINNLDTSSLDTIGIQIAARKMATDLIFDWLKIDVYGAIEARDTNVRHTDPYNDPFVDRN